MSSSGVVQTNVLEKARRERVIARRKRRIGLALRFLVLGVALFYALFPVVWIMSAALNPANTIVNQKLIPDNASFANFQVLLEDGFDSSALNPFFIWMKNSILVSGITAILSVLVSALSAYSFSRFRFRGRRGMLLTIFLVNVFPNSLTMVASFLLLQQVGRFIPSFGLGTHGGLILLYLGGAMGINTWLMKGYFDTIPREIDESAMIDGASHWTLFWRIFLPLTRPIITVVGIITFIFTYSDFLLALVVLRGQREAFTLAVGLNFFISGQFTNQWGVFAAGAIMGAIPVVILFMLTQDFIVGGLTQGAVKG
ncbi:MAG: ABC transporter permease subunit [Chloroflexi bacterium]|nr:MAG: ABC transporter permease subunit [Chloroflexota bacterium]